MRFRTFLLTGSLLASSLWEVGLLGSAAAWAQDVDSGTEVSVNPVAGGGGVLLYPGGQYMRVVHPLLQPGEKPADLGPIRLHLPGKRAPSLASAKPAPKKVVVAKATPKPAPQAPAPQYDGSYPMGGAAGLASSLGASAPAPAKPAPAKPVQTAKAEPPPAHVTAAPGLVQHSSIQFRADQTDPAETALGAIKFLAGDLNAALGTPASRVELIAYGGARGDKGSDARRLSLKRALAIRQVLIDDGVAADRIDVQAAGGVDDTGPADRVDVFIKA
jgi:outer membrane protein OmpA-like peptidoglycan-associated protein